MSPAIHTIAEPSLGQRRQFRYYSRCVRQFPTSAYYHKKRLEVAMGFDEGEPLQGALADYFFACWYELAREGVSLLELFAGKLPTHVMDSFLAYVNQGQYMPTISPLATRFSVLISPSMNVPAHRLYINKEDAQKISQDLVMALMDARSANDTDRLAQVQKDYLSHCLVCQDRMGFMMTWFALSKVGFEFDEAWQACKVRLEALDKERSS